MAEKMLLEMPASVQWGDPSVFPPQFPYIGPEGDSDKMAKSGDDDANMPDCGYSKVAYFDYICNRCHVCCYTEEIYMEHVEEWHQNVIPKYTYMCKTCGHLSHSIRSHKRHKKVHSCDNVLMFMCKVEQSLIELKSGPVSVDERHEAILKRYSNLTQGPLSRRWLLRVAARRRRSKLKIPALRPKGKGPFFCSLSSLYRGGTKSRKLDTFKESPPSSVASFRSLLKRPGEAVKQKKKKMRYGPVPCGKSGDSFSLPKFNVNERAPSSSAPKVPHGNLKSSNVGSAQVIDAQVQLPKEGNLKIKVPKSVNALPGAQRRTSAGKNLSAMAVSIRNKRIGKPPVRMTASGSNGAARPPVVLTVSEANGSLDKGPVRASIPNSDSAAEQPLISMAIPCMDGVAAKAPISIDVSYPGGATEKPAVKVTMSNVNSMVEKSPVMMAFPSPKTVTKKLPVKVAIPCPNSVAKRSPVKVTIPYSSIMAKRSPVKVAIPYPNSMAKKPGVSMKSVTGKGPLDLAPPDQNNMTEKLSCMVPAAYAGSKNKKAVASHQNGKRKKSSVPSATNRSEGAVVGTSSCATSKSEHSAVRMDSPCVEIGATSPYPDNKNDQPVADPPASSNSKNKICLKRIPGSNHYAVKKIEISEGNDNEQMKKNASPAKSLSCDMRSSCPLCSSVFKKPWHGIAHLIEQHSGTILSLQRMSFQPGGSESLVNFLGIKCSSCKIEFDSEKSYLRHMFQNHTRKLFRRVPVIESKLLCGMSVSDCYGDEQRLRIEIRLLPKP